MKKNILEPVWESPNKNGEEGMPNSVRKRSLKIRQYRKFLEKAYFPPRYNEEMENICKRKMYSDDSFSNFHSTRLAGNQSHVPKLNDDVDMDL